MAARLATSGTAIIRSTMAGMNDGSARGRPMPSMHEPGPSKLVTLRSAKNRWNTDRSGSTTHKRVASRR